MKARYWCFDEQALGRALAAWAARESAGGSPGSRKAMDGATADVQSFLSSPEAREHKMIHVVELSAVAADER